MKEQVRKEEPRDYRRLNRHREKSKMVAPSEYKPVLGILPQTSNSATGWSWSQPL
jgi:hypothetical protein